MSRRELNLKSKYFLYEIDKFIENAPDSYKEQIAKDIKKGEPIEWVFLQFFDLARLGNTIDSQVRELLNLNLESFILDDFEVDFFQKHFWFHYTGTTKSKSIVDEVDFTWEGGGLAEVSYEKILSKGYNRAKVKEVINKLKDEIDFEADCELRLNDDDENPRIELESSDEPDYLPDVNDVSKLFQKVLDSAKSG